MWFKPIYIEGSNLGDTWYQLLWNLNKFGRKYLITKGSYEGSYRLAFDDASGVIQYPHIRPLSPIMPEGSNLPAPTTDEDIEQYFAEYLMNGNIKENEDYKYSTWIVGGKYRIPGIEVKAQDHLTGDDYWTELQWIKVSNQLDWIINHFKKFGFGNEHCFLQIGYPESNFAYDIPYNNEQERKTSPCLRGLDFRIIEDTQEYFKCENCGYESNTYVNTFNYFPCIKCKGNSYREIKKINYLTTKVIYRSWDLYSGWPVNMGGFTLLNEYVASELGIEPGPLTFTCKSLHCYDFQLDVLKSWTGVNNG